MASKRVFTQSVKIEVARRTWSGHWQLHGADLVLGSAYGCRRQRILRADMDHIRRLAERLLREIVTAYRRDGRASLA